MADEPAPWQRLSTREVYRNPWIIVREDQVLRPDGSQGIYGVVTTTQAIGVLPFVDPDHVLLVRQWRYVAGRALWEMPTGGMHPGETPLATAQRELAEEVGYRAGRLEPLPDFLTSKSVVDETATLFLGYDLEPRRRRHDRRHRVPRGRHVRLRRRRWRWWWPGRSSTP